MLKYLLLAAVIATFVQVQAQTSKAKVAGNIKIENNKPAENATIGLLRAKDSTLVKAGVPNKDGAFEFENVNTGVYIIVVSFSGYTKQYSSQFIIDEANRAVTIPAIVLQPAIAT